MALFGGYYAICAATAAASQQKAQKKTATIMGGSQNFILAETVAAAKDPECRNCGAPVQRHEQVCSYCKSVQ